MRLGSILLVLVGCAGGDRSDVDDTDVVDTDVDVVDTDVRDTGDTGFVDSDPHLEDWPAQAGDYDFGPTTYLTELGIPPLDTDGHPVCCHDWGARSRDAIEDHTAFDDNAISRFAAQLASFVDVQAELDDQIELGNVAILLDHHDLPAGDGAYDLAVFLGEFGAGTAWAQASSGTGTFLAWDSSFLHGTGRPSTILSGATITGDQLVAAGGTSLTVDIAIPFIGAPLIVPARDVTISGTLDRDPAVGLVDAELSAYVLIDDFYVAYNDLATSGCACAALVQPPFSFSAQTGWEAHCPSSDDVIDRCGHGSICAYLLGDSLFASTPGFCGFVAPLIPGLADISTDRDPSDYEAFSVGLRIEGVAAEVEGVVTPL